MDAAAIQELLGSVGPWAPVLLGAAALIEYLLPPFPGDTVTLVGGVMAYGGSPSWAAVFLALAVGNVTGILLDWELGRYLGARSDRLPSREEKRWWQPLCREQFARFEVSYRRWGPGLLAVNRFLPAARAFFFLAAGAAGLSRKETLLWGMTSALVWNGLVLAVGATLGGNLEEIFAFVSQVSTGGWAALGAAVAAYGVFWVVRRIRRRR